MPGARPSLCALLALTAVAIGACGGGGDETSAGSTGSGTTATTAGACSPIEEVDVPLSGQHEDREFTAADYSTNPPAGGDHNPVPLAAGRFYTSPPPLGQSVHLLEHGAVIGWTNGLSQRDMKAVEDEFQKIASDGYYQLATVENPDMDVPFALSAWGAVQKCAQVDASVIRPFVEQWYASPKSAEGGFACQGDARALPNC
jgi:hypothetical protein